MPVTWTEVKTDLMSPGAMGGPTAVVPAVVPDALHLKLRPGRPIRVGVSHQTLGNVWLYTGFIDAIEPSDMPDDWATVKLRCIDALGEAGRGLLVDTVESPAETTRNRFVRILDKIRWPATKRNVSTSAVRPLYAAVLDDQVVDALRRVGDSESGAAFADNNGNIVLKHRDWMIRETGSYDAVIGNIGYGDICPSGWKRSFDRADITTQVVLGVDAPDDVDPEPANVVQNDFDGQVLYGIEPYEKTDLWNSNPADVQNYAGRIMATRNAKISMPRISAVTVDAFAAGDDGIDLMTTLSIFTPSLYRCRLETPRGVVFDDNFFATGVTHDISSSEWVVDIALDRADPFQVLTPDEYVWDTARWDRSLWN